MQVSNSQTFFSLPGSSICNIFKRFGKIARESLDATISYTGRTQLLELTARHFDSLRSLELRIKIKRVERTGFRANLSYKVKEKRRCCPEEWLGKRGQLETLIFEIYFTTSSGNIRTDSAFYLGNFARLLIPINPSVQ